MLRFSGPEVERMPSKTRSNRKRGATRRSGGVRVHTYFDFQSNNPVILAAMVHTKKYPYKIVAFQNGKIYEGRPNISEATFNKVVNDHETLRKKGVPGSGEAVYRTTDKTPEQFAAIAKKYGGKETPEWFEKQLAFVRDQTAAIKKLT